MRTKVTRNEGKRPLGRPRVSWLDVKINLKDIGYEMNWIHLAQNDQRRAHVNLGSVKGGEFLNKLSDY
jgi:hypothetical protein